MAEGRVRERQRDKRMRQRMSGKNRYKDYETKGTKWENNNSWIRNMKRRERGIRNEEYERIGTKNMKRRI